MFCKTCQTQLPQDALACPICGTQVTEDEKQQAVSTDTPLTPTESHYESDLPVDENDISPIIAVHHTHATPILADVYNEEEALSAIQTQPEATLPYAGSRVVPTYTETDQDPELAATELQTVHHVPAQDIPTYTEADQDPELAATELQTVHHVPTQDVPTYTEADQDPELADDKLQPAQDVLAYEDQPFSEYALAQEQVPAAIPMTQTNGSAPFITQADAGSTVNPPPARISQVPTPRRQQRMSLVLLTIALIGLGLLLLIENGGAIFFATAYQPTQVHARATVQAYKLATAQVQATNISQLQATAQAQVNTGKLKVSLVQAETNNPDALYTLATSEKPNLDATNTASKGICTNFNGGTFHVLENEKNRFYPCRSASGSDFVFQTQMNINAGDAGGLYFRATDNYTEGYVLQFDSKGYYDFILHSNTNSVQWLQAGLIAGFKAGYNQENLVTIIAQGSNFYFFINTQFIGQVSDNTYSSGSIYLIAANSQATNTDIVYSNTEFWDLS